MFEFFSIAVVFSFLTGFILGRNTNNHPHDQDTAMLVNNNKQWVKFIAEYLSLAKTKAEKAFINRILKDLRAQGHVITAEFLDSVSDVSNAHYVMNEGVDDSAILAEEQGFVLWGENAIDEAPITKSSEQIKLDNASILLYFGAFLFVSATGLFVGISDVPGLLRAGIVGLVSLLFYCSGLWLYSQPRFKQAGVAFTGIGIAVLPFGGLAAYSLVFDHTNGALIWFVASILCAVMYWHALRTIRKPILNYIFLFTILSLFESSVALVDSPIYVFGWVMQVVGIGFMWFGRSAAVDPGLQRSSTQLGQAIVPIAVLASLFGAGNQGLLQLGISTAIAGVYYIVESILARHNKLELYAVGHAVLLISFGTSTYALTNDMGVLVASFIGLIWLQVLALYYFRKNFFAYDVAQNIVVGLAVILTFLAGAFDELFFVSTVTVCLVAWLTWLSTKSHFMYAFAAFCLTLVPIVYGQPGDSRLSSSCQVAWCLVACGMQIVIGRYALGKQTSVNLVGAMTLVSMATAVGFAFLSDGWALVIAACIVAIVAGALSYVYRDKAWLDVTPIVLLLPLLRYSWADKRAVIAAMTALIAAIVMALVYKRKVARWVGAATWLVFLYAVGAGGLGFRLGYKEYAFLFVVGAFGLVLSRALARGVLFRSDKIPLSTYENSASLAYVIGYFVAMIISSFIALFHYDQDNMIVPTVLLSWLVLIPLLGKKVEKDPGLYGFIPAIIVLLIYGIMRPTSDDTLLTNFTNSIALIVTVTAFSYWQVTSFSPKTLKIYAAGAAVIPVGLGVFGSLPVVWSTAVALAVFGSLLYLYNASERGTQGVNEITQATVFAAIMWCMGISGVDNSNVFAHVLAIMFAWFAYQRYQIKQSQNGDAYTMLALASSSLPLAISALSGISGGFYGWLLLLEQVLFMLFGVWLGKKLIFRWGLYAGVLVVLFQLRDLAWVALTFLAVVVISIAVYEIQKRDGK